MSPLDDCEGWVFVRPSCVPEEWKDRLVEVSLLPLLPGELHELLDIRPQLSAKERALVHFVAQGLPRSEIARELGVSSRSVSRRLARLRERFDVQSTGELVAVLSRRGFTVSQE